MERAPVVVVGGGLAGLAAATVLAERGVKVTIIERERFLGGRAGSWSDTLADGTSFEMERGFHAFFRQYYNVRALIRRVDPELSCLVPLTDYPLLGPNGWAESFAGLPRRAPFNLISLMWRTPSMRLADVLTLHMKTASEMVAFDPARTYERWDDVTAKQYLDALRFPPRARQMLFDVFAHSFFNPEEEYSAAELLAMFHFYFLGNPEGLVFDVMNRPFAKALFEPLRAYLEARGATFRLGEGVDRIAPRTSGFEVQLAGETLPADAVVLATSVPALQRITASSPELGDAAWRSDVATLGVTNRFAVLRLWLDRPLRADRAPFAGTTGIGVLDNVSIYEKLEDESAAWAQRTGGTVVELHAYALDDAMNDDDARAALLRDLHAVYPEARETKILDERFLVRRDCPSFAPGSYARRPGVPTPSRGLVLAGDFVKLPFPSALMERAVTSGFLAANALLRDRALSEVEVRTIPPRGLLRKLGPLPRTGPRSGDHEEQRQEVLRR